jgi:RNA-dependent RNA polymerase
MKNDCLPTIAHAHLAWGDFLDNGVNEAKCIQLSQLHSDAVDYNKTGNAAVMARALRPRKWPHFMEKNNKPEHCTYHSGTVLGQLYDVVERIDFIPSLEKDFDKRILNCKINVTDDQYKFSRELKVQYDIAIRRVMAQHEIKTEFEVWSTFVLGHSNMNKDYKFHEDMGTISTGLFEDFRKRVYKEAGGRNFHVLAPLAVAMYKITHEEMAAALATHRKDNPYDERLFNSSSTLKIEHLPLISFPWIFSRVLGQIAVGHYDHPGAADTVTLSQLNEGKPENLNFGDTGVDPTAPSGLTQPVLPPENDDPFGLNLQDAVTVRSNHTMSLDEGDIGSLEQLLDFGLLNPPSTPSSSLVFNKSEKESSLLDLDGGWVADPMNVMQNLKENVRGNGMSQELLEPKGEQCRIIEVEEEEHSGGDTLGINKLSQLAGL